MRPLHPLLLNLFTAVGPNVALQLRDIVLQQAKRSLKTMRRIDVDQNSDYIYSSYLFLFFCLI